MTTIAYKDGIMAADTKISDGDDYTMNMTKIKKIDGCLVGVSGDFDMVHWFHSKFKREVATNKVILSMPGNHKCEFEALIVTPDKKIYLYTDKFISVPFKSFGYAVTGSGTALALGAMFAGADAITAVKAAHKHDSNTGGRIQVLYLDKPRKRKCTIS